MSGSPLGLGGRFVCSFLRKKRYSNEKQHKIPSALAGSKLLRVTPMIDVQPARRMKFEVEYTFLSSKILTYTNYTKDLS
jgi:hypothetical protein